MNTASRASPASGRTWRARPAAVPAAAAPAASACAVLAKPSSRLTAGGLTSASPSSDGNWRRYAASAPSRAGAGRARRPAHGRGRPAARARSPSGRPARG